MKIGQVVSEKKTFKDYTILYMYLAQGQGQIAPGDEILIATKKIYDIHILYVSAISLKYI